MSITLTGSDESFDDLEETVYDLLSIREHNATANELYDDLEWAELEESKYNKEDVESAVDTLKNDEPISTVVYVDGSEAYRLNSI